MTEIRACAVDETDLSRDNDVTLSAALRRRIGLIVGVTVLLGVVGGVVVALRPTTYTSTVKVQLHPLPGNPLSADTVHNSPEIAIAMNSEAATVASIPVVSTITSPRIAAGSSNVKVSLITNTTSMNIAYTADSSGSAKSGANQLATAFLAYREGVAKTANISARDQLRVLQRQALDQLRATTAETRNKQATPAQSARIALLSNRVIQFQQAITKLDAGNPPSGSLVSPASVPKASGAKLRLLVPVAAALVGFFLTAVFAAWRGRNERVIRGADHVAVAGRPVLANLTGRMRGDRGTENSDAALRRARVGLRAAAGPHSVVVLSPSATGDDSRGDLNREIARRIGRSLSDAGFRVVLVDCRQADTRRERRARAKRKARAALLAEPAGPTLDDLFDSGWTPETPLARVGPLDVVHAARRPLGTDQVRLADLLHVMSREYDFVIVEAESPATPAGLAAVFAGDHMVLTAVDRRTRRADIELAVERAERIGTRIAGVVVSAPSRRLTTDGPRTADAKRGGRSAKRSGEVGKTAGWVPDAQ